MLPRPFQAASLQLWAALVGMSASAPAHPVLPHVWSPWFAMVSSWPLAVSLPCGRRGRPHQCSRTPPGCRDGSCTWPGSGTAACTGTAGAAVETTATERHTPGGARGGGCCCCCWHWLQWPLPRAMGWVPAAAAGSWQSLHCSHPPVPPHARACVRPARLRVQRASEPVEASAGGSRQPQGRPQRTFGSGRRG
jgi:hypothetical protein